MFGSISMCHTVVALLHGRMGKDSSGGVTLDSSYGLGAIVALARLGFRRG